jgi:broad specificity phosphatase PhoE
MERETGIGPATNSLEGCDSTIELLPLFDVVSTTKERYHSLSGRPSALTAGKRAEFGSDTAYYRRPVSRRRLAKEPHGGVPRRIFPVEHPPPIRIPRKHQVLTKYPVERLVVASSMIIYGEGSYRDADNSPATPVALTIEQLKLGEWEARNEKGERLFPVPTRQSKTPDLASIYALSKYDQEQMCLMVGRAYGIPAVALAAGRRNAEAGLAPVQQVYAGTRNLPIVSFRGSCLDDAVGWLKDLGVTGIRTGLSWADSFRPGAEKWFDRQIKALEPFEVTLTFCFTPEHCGVPAGSHQPAERTAAIRGVLRMHGDALYIVMMGTGRTGKVILVRHGEAAANRAGIFASADDNLTEAGRRQAHDAARELGLRFRPDVLVSSSFPRARQTAEIIAGTLGIELEVVGGLHERNFGCLIGHPYARMGELMLGDSSYDPARSWLWKPESGESLEDVRCRSVAVLEHLRAKHSAREIVVVCHGAVMQAICANLAGAWRDYPVPPNCGIVAIDDFERRAQFGSGYGNIRPPVTSGTEPVT